MNREIQAKLEKVKALLKTQSATCVVYSDEPHLYFDKGVQPLFKALEEKRLKNAYVADRVIGKGAAMLLIYGEAAAVHAELISIHAKEYFDRHGIEYSFDKLCPYIQNRAGSGMCPMESAVLNIEDSGAGIAAMRQKQKELSGK